MSDRQCMRHRHRVTLFCEECLGELQAEIEQLQQHIKENTVPLEWYEESQAKLAERGERK